MSTTTGHTVETCREFEKHIIETYVENGRHMDRDDLQFTDLFNSILLPGNWRGQPSKAWSEEEVLSLLVSSLQARNVNFEQMRIQRGSHRGMGWRIIDTVVALVCDSEGPLVREHRRVQMRKCAERKRANEVKKREVWFKQAATGRGRPGEPSCLIQPRRSKPLERRLGALCLTMMSSTSDEKKTPQAYHGHGAHRSQVVQEDKEIDPVDWRGIQLEGRVEAMGIRDEGWR